MSIRLTSLSPRGRGRGPRPVGAWEGEGVRWCGFLQGCVLSRAASPPPHPAAGAATFSRGGEKEVGTASSPPGLLACGGGNCEERVRAERFVFERGILRTFCFPVRGQVS